MIVTTGTLAQCPGARAGLLGSTADRSDTRGTETLDGVDPSGVDGLSKLAEGT